MYFELISCRMFCLLKPYIYYIIYFICNFWNCIYAQDVELKQTIIEQELKSIQIKSSDSIFIKFGGNEILNEFLNSNILKEIEDIEFHPFRTSITENDQNSIFNAKEVKYLTHQLATSFGEFVYLLDLPPNIHHYCGALKQIKENQKIGVPLNTGLYTLTISNPVLTKDKQFLLFATGRGYKNEMSGGIKIYKKKGSEYERYALLDAWLE